MASFATIIDRDGLPANPHTERVVLGAMLSDPIAVVEAMERLQPDDFSLDSHQRIYSAIVALAKTSNGIDLTTVSAALTKTKELGAIGGPSYLASLYEGLPRNLAMKSYIQILKEKGTLRRLIDICNRGMTRATDQTENAADVEAFLARELQDVALSSSDASMEHIGDFTKERYPTAESFFTLPEKSRGLLTHFTGLDALTLGLHAGELTIIAARPSMGKTAYITSLLGNYVPYGTRIAVFPLEQGKESMLKRMACGMARASFKDLRAGTSSVMDKRYITEEIERIKKSGIFWSDSSGTTISKIRARAIRLDRELKTANPEDGLQLIVVDQLTWVDRGDLDSKKDQRAQFGDVAKGCKALAKELGIPVILVAQLGRPPESKTGDVRKPRMSDLAESGLLEQHADVVMFLHRPEYYNRDDDTLKGKGFAIVDKNRDGETGEIEMTFNGSCTLWTDVQPVAFDFNKLKNTPPDYGPLPPTSAYNDF